MVSGKVGIIFIGIAIIAVIILTPREFFTKERAQGFVGTFGLQPAQAEIQKTLDLTKATPKEIFFEVGRRTGNIPIVSPKPTKIKIFNGFQKQPIVQEISISPKPKQITGANGFGAEAERLGLTTREFIESFQPIVTPIRTEEQIKRDVFNLLGGRT